MPTYEYQCTVCGHRFEKFQSFSDEPIKACPNCGEPVKKVVSAAGIIFKGSGWYINDSKKTSSSVTPAPAAKDSEASKAEPAAAPAPAASSEKTESSSNNSSPAASTPTSTKESAA